jgi:hypothetical protein
VHPFDGFVCSGKIGLSGFRNWTVQFSRVLTPWTELTPLPISSLFTFLLISPWRRPKNPWWRFLDSSIESFASWVKSTLQEPVYPLPQPVFPISKLFSPNPQSLCPIDGFEIPLVHCLHSCHRTIPCNISKFPWLNRSDS